MFAHPLFSVLSLEKYKLSLNPHRSSIHITDFLHVSQSQHSLPTPATWMVPISLSQTHTSTTSAESVPETTDKADSCRPIATSAHLHRTSSPASPRVPFQRLVSDFLPPTKGERINRNEKTRKYLFLGNFP